ncbi:MAG: hypothetical protein ABIP80_03025 [Ferruginibacter sp.]
MKKHFELFAALETPDEYTIPSRRMVKTLKDCVRLETTYPGKTYGPADISGSLLGLYKRGLLEINLDSQIKSKPASWYVTTKGFQFLLSISDKKINPDESQILSNMYKLQQNLTTLHDSMYKLKLATDKFRKS